MSKPLVTDELWEIIEPLLPKEPPKPKGGRPRIPDRAALTGIIFVLRSGLQWEMLPQEMGCGSGMTCWRRVRDWQKAGVWKKLHKLLLDKLNDAGEIGWSRVSLDSATIAARGVKKGSRLQARTRRIRENQARSAILWSSAEEFHWS
jgi:transposase